MLTPWPRRRLGFPAYPPFLPPTYVRRRCRRHLGVLLVVHALPSVTAPIQHPAAPTYSHSRRLLFEAERPARSLNMQSERRGFRLMPRFRDRFEGLRLTVVAQDAL